MTASSPFEQLQAFLTGTMRMSHIYQPLMLRVLIEGGGRASLREIAAAFLARERESDRVLGGDHQGDARQGLGCGGWI